MPFVHVASGLLGLYLIYLTFVMKESTEGKWVNRLEELWIQIDEHSKTVGETTRALFGKLARKITSLFSLIFGRRMISVRVIGISSSLSFASFLFFCGLCIEIVVWLVMKYTPASNRLDASFLNLEHQAPLLVLTGIVFLLTAGLCVILAILTIRFKSPIWAWISCLPAAFWLYGTYRMLQSHLAYDNQFGICMALGISIASDLLLLIIVRQSLMWLSVLISIPRMIAMIAMQGIVLFLIFFIPYQLPIVWRPEMAKNSTGVSLFILAIFNIPTVFASIAFGISLFVVLLHRISWPLLSQWTYVLTRNDVLQKRKAIRAIGCALLVFGLSGHSRALWQIAEEILK
jgi:hypothetical protein